MSSLQKDQFKADENEIKDMVKSRDFEKVAYIVSTDTKLLSERFVKSLYDIFIQEGLLLEMVYMYQGSKVLPGSDQLNALLLKTEEDQRSSNPQLVKAHLIEIGYSSYAIALLCGRKDFFPKIRSLCNIDFAPTAVLHMYSQDKNEKRREENFKKLKKALDVTQVAQKLSEALRDSGNDLMSALKTILKRGIDPHGIACFYLLHQDACPFEVGDCSETTIQVKMKGESQHTLLSTEEKIIINDEELLL